MPDKPLKLRLIGADDDKPKFYQKYIVLKRNKTKDLFRMYAKTTHNVEATDAMVNDLVMTLDGMMTLQGSHYFVVNLDEKEGQQAMIKYWSMKGYPEEDILSCMPKLGGK